MPDPLYNLIKHIQATCENAPKLQKIIDHHQYIFRIAKGSLYGHHNREGGYLQHINDCIDMALFIYNKRNDYQPVRVYWPSIILVLILYNIDKPFMQQEMSADPNLPPWTKEQRVAFKQALIAEYGIEIDPEESNALKYIEAPNNNHKLTELGVICHAADFLITGQWHTRIKHLIEQKT